MPRTERRKSASGFYHVVMRGNGRQNLFEDDADRRSFLSYLRGDAERFGVRVLAWCLMSNHIHLLLEDRDDNLSEMMRSLATSYALRFNRRGGHAGHVFQQRFYSNPIEDEAYLLQAMRYIHDNPASRAYVTRTSIPGAAITSMSGRRNMRTQGSCSRCSEGRRGLRSSQRAAGRGRTVSPVAPECPTPWSGVLRETCSVRCRRLSSRRLIGDVATRFSGGSGRRGSRYGRSSALRASAAEPFMPQSELDKGTVPLSSRGGSMIRFQ